MNRFLLLAVTGLLSLLAACNPIYGEDPTLDTSSVTVTAPGTATAMLSGRSVTLSAGSSAHVTFGLRLHCAENDSDNLTADGCQYLRNGTPTPYREHLTVSTTITSQYYDTDGTLVTNHNYPVGADIPGLTFTFAKNPLPMLPPHGAISTTDLTITADESVEPGTYQVYVGMPSGTNAKDTNYRQPLTVTVLPASGAISTVTGTITNLDASWLDPEVTMMGYTEAGYGEVAFAQVGSGGSFSLSLPAEPTGLGPLDFSSCEGDVSASGVLHTSATLEFSANGSDPYGYLLTSGPSGYELSFLLYVDRPVSVDVTCTHSSGGKTYIDVADYDFPEAGWYAIFAAEEVTDTGSSKTNIAVNSAVVEASWEISPY